MPPFATGAQVAAYLNKSGDAALVVRAGQAADIVSALIRAQCRRSFDATPNDTAVVAGTHLRVLVLGERPVIAVGAVSLDGAAVGAGEFRWTRSGRMWRDAGWGGPEVEVEVTYSHGYASTPAEEALGYPAIPADLNAVCITAAARLVVNPAQAQREEHSIDGHWSEATLAAPAGFTVAELSVLDRYRRRCWP